MVHTKFYEEDNTGTNIAWNLEEIFEDFGVEETQRDLLYMWLETRDETIGTMLEDATVRAFEKFVYEL